MYTVRLSIAIVSTLYGHHYVLLLGQCIIETSGSGTIQSPGFPGEYANNLDECWVIYSSAEYVCRPTGVTGFINIG